MRDASEPDRVLRGGLIPPARFDQIGGGAGHDDRRPVDRGAGRQRLVVVDRRLQRTVMANEMAGPLRRFRRRRQRRARRLDAGKRNAGMLDIRTDAQRVDSYACFRRLAALAKTLAIARRSEEHTSELQSLMRISYAVFG